MEVKSNIYGVTTVEELCRKGNSLFCEGKYLEAKKYSEQAIQTEAFDTNDYLYKSGAYVTLANCIGYEHNIAEKWIKSEKIDYSIVNIMQKYYLEALKIKPSNQIALSNISLQFFILKEYDKSLNYLFQINDYTVINETINSFMIYMLGHPCKEFLNFLDKFIEYCKENYVQDNSKFIELIDWIEEIIIRLCNKLYINFITNDEKLEAYEISKYMLAKGENDISTHLNFISTCNILGLPTVAEKSIMKVTQLLNQEKAKKQKGSAQRNYIKEKEYQYKSLVGWNALLQEKYIECIEILEENIKYQGNNTDYYNLARSYLLTKNYSKALINCQKALFIMSDEMAYQLMGDIHYSIGDFTTAKQWYEKSLAFVNKEKLNFYYKENEQEVLSIKCNIDKQLEKLYENLIFCNIKLNDLVQARAIYEIANNKFPTSQILNRLLETLDIIQNVEAQQQEIEKKSKMLHIELEKQIQRHSKEIGKVREWANSLIQIQNKYESNIIRDEEEWLAIENRMADVIIQMKREDDGYRGKLEIRKHGLKEKFPKLNSISLDFLCTAEYLFDTHSNQFIDYAPILVEYCKVVEKELNIYLTKKISGIKTKKNKNYTLGKCVKILNEYINPKNEYFLSMLNDLLEYRNGSAHSGQSTEKKVREVRKMIMDNGLLEYILSL